MLFSDGRPKFFKMASLSPFGLGDYLPPAGRAGATRAAGAKV
jgi:hypothetical protein